MLPLEHQTVADAVYQRLRSNILEGVLLPGERIEPAKICRAFQISRTPLREVLRQLHNEGLIVIRPHRGAVVARLDLRDVEELYEIRGNLEGYAVRLAIKRRSSDVLAQLDRCLSQMTEATNSGEHERLPDIHAEFHRDLYLAGGNRQLLLLIDELRLRCEWFRRLVVGLPRRPEASLAAHRRILNAFRAGDAERAELLVKKNLVDTVSSLVDQMRTNDTQFTESEANPNPSVLKLDTMKSSLAPERSVAP